MSTPAPLRIGEFARRTGVSAELLRAWERRYGLLQPVRSSGGYRLYGDDDAARVARMRAGIDAGLSAAEAARAALGREQSSGPGLTAGADRLLAAVRDYDEAAVQALLDEMFAAFALESVLRDVILPALTAIGRATADGTMDIGEEHFASNLIRGRLLSLARLWGRGAGPLALLACCPGEQHDLTLIAFGLVLRSFGWRILFLGANTPLATVDTAARMTDPAVVVIAAFNPRLLREHAADLAALAGRGAVRVSGPGAEPDLCAELGLEHLGGGLFEAAAGLAAGVA